MEDYQIDLSKKKCTDRFILPFYDCDYLKRIKISTLLKVIAQIAGKDYTDRGLGHEFLWERGYVFLLSRISMHIDEYAIEPEELIVSTWEYGKKGAMFLRGSTVEHDGKIITDCESAWIVVNPQSRKIIRPSQFPWLMPQYEYGGLKSLLVDKILHSEETKIGEHKVEFSDLDQNGHVYNATYADIALNAVSPQQYEKNVENFRINFVNEAVLGDLITIYSSEKDNKYMITGRINDKICFEIEIIYK